VRCNQWVKFGELKRYAEALGAEVLATGHYARVRESNGRYRLMRGADVAKDQSYVLWMLTQEDLRATRFPVGEMNKSETRRIAEDLGLRTAAKPDSQEICFVRDGDLPGYIERHLATENGPIIDVEGQVVGEHHGVQRYTVGQRKGLGISLGMPVFVTSIDASSNTVTVGGRDRLAVGEIELDEASFTYESPEVGAEVLVQYRAHGDVSPARVVPGGRLRIAFEDPVHAVAPGQSAALYVGDELIGGGIIKATTPAFARA
jgi:tRNA-specific 2-thiouridylase